MRRVAQGRRETDSQKPAVLPRARMPRKGKGAQVNARAACVTNNQACA